MKRTKRNNLELLQFENMPSDGCFQFMTTIRGGVSQGAYNSLNLGLYSGDDNENVNTNFGLLADAIDIPYDNIIAAYQTHEDKIVVIDEAWLTLSDDRKKGNLHGIDALITTVPNICITVGTADCVPIILYDPIRKVAAVIHAGWKGTVQKIGAKATQIMIDELGCEAQNILAGIGASISPSVFEVGEELGTVFANAGYDLTQISHRNKETGKLHIDLWEANKTQLIEIGVKAEHIEVSQLCTYTLLDDFFSARRQSIKSGRILSGIYLKQ